VINEGDAWRLYPGAQREAMESEYRSYLDYIKDPELKKKSACPCAISSSFRPGKEPERTVLPRSATPFRIVVPPTLGCNAHTSEQLKMG
jgi:hypothetical protein